LDEDLEIPTNTKYHKKIIEDMMLLQVII